MQEDVVRALRTIQEEFSARIFSSVMTVTQPNLLDDEEMMGQSAVTMSLWNGLLCLDKWLNVNGAPSAYF